MDREKVIAGLTMLADTKNDGSCEGLKCCKIAEDALELLKEYDTVEPLHKCMGKAYTFIKDSSFNYCPYCGKPVTWESR